MKAASFLLAMLAPCAFGQVQTRMPAVPLANPDPDFPLHVHILTVRWGGDTVHRYRSIQGEMRGGPGYYEPTGSAHGFGAANLLGNPAQGFYYAFDCGSSFQPNSQPQDFYQARWKRPGQSLEILMQPVGADRGELCDLKVSIKQLPFDPAFSAAALPGSTIGGVIWNEPEIAFAEPDSDYPVHLHIVSGFRRVNSGGVQGYGTANLVGDSPQGLDFNYNCTHGLIPNAQPDEIFQGHWVKKDKRLEILLQPIGSNHIDRCQLDVTLKSSPYPDTPTTSAAAPAADTPVLTRR